MKCTAFASRFTTTWWSRSGSAAIGGRSVGDVDLETELAALGERAHLVDAPAPMTSRRSVGRSSSCSRPARSRPSSTIWPASARSRRLLDWMVSARRFCFGVSGPREPAVEQVRRPADRGERRPEIVGDPGEELVLEPVDLPEPDGHPVEGPGEVADLARPGDGQGLRELPCRHRLRGRAEPMQRARDPEHGERAEPEPDEGGRGQRGEAEDPGAAGHRLERGLAPSELGSGRPVEPLERVLELHGRMRLAGGQLDAAFDDLPVLRRGTRAPRRRDLARPPCRAAPPGGRGRRRPARARSRKIARNARSFRMV